MAEIDKSLPNVSPTPSDPEFKEQEIALETRDELIPQISNENIEINPMEDGGAEISFNPTQELQSSDHSSNLAEIIDEQELTEIGAELVDDYNEYRSSRQDWEMAYTNGLDLLGFKYERRTEPFKGASGVTHPVLAESVTQFQSQAYKELLPADGPVRTQIVGSITPERQDQANRVKDFMNYQIMDVMKEYESEFDQMLFYLPLSGSTFKKVYYDSILGRAVSKFIPAEDLIVPYSATSLEDEEAVIHVIKIS